MEEQKKLLSIRDLVVKFRVRGRILTAIRGISLDIYENESIAIVGESGSGKSVFTKTFAGMLDENGFIDEGSIQFYDGTLSDTKVSYSRSLRKRVFDIAGRLNAACIEMKEEQEASSGKSASKEETPKEPVSEKTIDTVQGDSAETPDVSELDPEIVKRNEEIAREIALYVDVLPPARRSMSAKRITTKLIAELKNGADISDPGVRDKYFQLTKDSEWRRIQKYAKKLNASAKYEYGADIFRKIRELDEEKEAKGRLPEEEYQVFRKKIDDITFRKTENYNYRQTLDPRKQKDEIKKCDAEQKKFAAELKQIEAELKAAKKAKADALKADAAYLQSYKEQKAKLKQEYKETVKDKIASEETKTRNRMLAREIVLSTGRFPLIRRKKTIRAIIRKLNKAMKEGVDLTDSAKRDEIYKDVTFRVEFREEDAEGFSGFANIDLSKMKYSGDWMEVRGERIATVFQDPMTSLNPIITIGKQITSVIIKHQHCSEAEARKRALILMKKVGIPNAEKRFDDYPFQYSGGMRQRIVIAIALSCQPKILICDEPTTALDVTIQAQILKLIKDLQKEFGYTIVFITHDLGVVANIADRVAVLYAGQIVELGKVEEVFYDPRHPYTWALLSSLPQLAQRNTKLFSIQGTPPSLYNKIIGDPFAPRNRYCMKIDTLAEPPYFAVSDTHIAKTWLLDPRSPKVEKPEAIDNIHEKLMNAFNI